MGATGAFGSRFRITAASVPPVIPYHVPMLTQAH